MHVHALSRMGGRTRRPVPRVRVPTVRYVASVSETAAATRTDLVEGLIERFPHIPPEAVLKEDLLRAGLAFDASALTDNLDGEVKPKSYFIFSFDQKPLAELGEAALRRPPEEIALTAGPYDLRRTIVSVRVYLTVLRLCQYFGAKEECGFCDINHNWRQHRKAGRPYTGVKPVEDVLEALALIDRYDDGASHAYTLTGGSVTSTVDGLAEAEFYGRYAQAIEERFPGRWIGKVVAQALPR